MKLADFPLLDARVHTVTLDRPTASSAWKNNGEVRLWRDQQGIWLSQDASLEEVRAGSVGLDALLERKDFLWLLLRQRAAEIHLQCAQPTDWLPLDEPLDLQVDEKLAGDLARDGRIPRADVALAVAWCTDTFLIEGESQRLAAVRHDSVFATDWQIVGNGWRADLSVGGEGQILLKRVARAGHAVDSWSLVQGENSFCRCLRHHPPYEREPAGPPAANHPDPRRLCGTVAPIQRAGVAAFSAPSGPT